MEVGMAKYGKKASSKVEKAIHERKRGTLKSGRSGKTVKSRKQAIAIGLSEARKAGAKVPAKKKSAAKTKTRKSSSRNTAARKSSSSKTSRSKTSRSTRSKGTKSSRGRKSR